MIEAIEEAKKAASKGEVPIGAVVVRDGEIIGDGTPDEVLGGVAYGVIR